MSASNSGDILILYIGDTVRILSGYRCRNPVLGAKEHILLVDDELVLVDLNKQLLERLNNSVTTRTSSIEALEAFQANPKRAVSVSIVCALSIGFIAYKSSLK